MPDTLCGLDRLVESSRIKKALEGVYNGVLAKGASPFVYLRYAAAIGMIVEFYVCCAVSKSTRAWWM